MTPIYLIASFSSILRYLIVKLICLGLLLIHTVVYNSSCYLFASLPKILRGLTFKLENLEYFEFIFWSISLPLT